MDESKLSKNLNTCELSCPKKSGEDLSECLYTPCGLTAKSFISQTTLSIFPSKEGERRKIPYDRNRVQSFFVTCKDEVAKMLDFVHSTNQKYLKPEMGVHYGQIT